MPPNKPEALPTAKSIASYVMKSVPKLKMAPMGPMESVREADHNGHHIVIRTTYRIEVDGRPVLGHIDVSNEGTIAYHGLPNISFDSAVDLVKRLIDQFPEDFTREASRPRLGKTPKAKPDMNKPDMNKPDMNMPDMNMAGMNMPGMKMPGMSGGARPKTGATRKSAPRTRKP